MQNDMIAGLDLGDFGTDLLHDASALVAEQVRQIFVRTLDTLDLAELGAADAAHFDLDQHLAVTQRRYLDLIEAERFLLLNKNGGGSFHGMNHQ